MKKELKIKLKSHFAAGFGSSRSSGPVPVDAMETLEWLGRIRLLRRLFPIYFLFLFQFFFFFFASPRPRQVLIFFFSHRGEFFFFFFLPPQWNEAEFGDGEKNKNKKKKKNSKSWGWGKEKPPRFLFPGFFGEFWEKESGSVGEKKKKNRGLRLHSKPWKGGKKIPIFKPGIIPEKSWECRSRESAKLGNPWNSRPGSKNSMEFHPHPQNSMEFHPWISPRSI